MAKRGVPVTYETVREWCRKFGSVYAARLRKKRARFGGKWHLDEVFLKMNGVQHYLWRAVDQNGAVIDSTAEQNGSQLLKGTKGAIGVDATYVYLAIVTNATVTDAAYVMQALGARDALNLDGGGTAAMWIGGSYKVGPGRLLPNAIVLTKP